MRPTLEEGRRARIDEIPGPERRFGISPMSPRARRCDHPHMAWTVLIVDDHPGFRGFARRLLEADGFTVVGEAGDGGSAVEAAARLRPALVLLDVMLPDT